MSKYQNNLSIIFGILCLIINYLHSTWIGGFYGYGAGFDDGTLPSRVSHLILSTATPSFFILWGYLSYKYIQSEESGIQFLVSKLIQFYPIYLFSFLINLIFRFDYISQYPLWKLVLTALGLYYEQGIGAGGNVYFVIFWVTVTIALFKACKVSSTFVVMFTVVCLIATKVLPHESDFCYVKYFGYYAAYFLGTFLRKIEIFKINASSSLARIIPVTLIICVVLITVVSNYMGFYALEIEFSPNSPEQLLLCTVVLFVTYKIFDYWNVSSFRFFPFNIMNQIGNNTYGHFLIHAHLIRLVAYVNSFFLFDALIVQLFAIVFVSYVSVMWVLPAYRYIEGKTLNSLLRSG